MKFKVGDKIKLVGPKNPNPKSQDWQSKYTGKTGIIVAFNDQDLFGPYMHYISIYLYDCDSVIYDRGNYKLHWNVDPQWLELLIKPGEQMLFSFMNEGSA